MVRLKHLLIGALLLSIPMGAGGVPRAEGSEAAKPPCSKNDERLGNCVRGTLVENGAQIGAGSGGGDESSSPGWTPPEGWFKCNGSWRPPEDAAFWKPMCRDEFTVTGPPTPSLSDVRKFYPASTTISSEPHGWALKGRPFNPVADTALITRSGTVLGIPTEVTFTPIRWNWNYGDGATRTSETGGKSWAGAGQKRFTTTATSHTYPAKGEFTVSLSVDYTVTYRFGNNPWRPIDGVLTIPAESLPVRVFVGSTVLTTGPCEPAHAHTC